jgi:transcription initiation factor TFIID subunit 5
MSAPSQTPGAPAPGAYQGPAATPPAPQHTASTTTGQAGTGTTGGPMSNQNLNQIVTDYLLKRGFNRTEEVFRQESKHLGPDGKPIYQLANLGPKKYQKAFGLLREWVENNLDIYKVSLGLDSALASLTIPVRTVEIALACLCLLLPGACHPCLY